MSDTRESVGPAAPAVRPDGRGMVIPGSTRGGDGGGAAPDDGGLGTASDGGGLGAAPGDDGLGSVPKAGRPGGSVRSRALPLDVPNEIGRLRRVCLHRPGAELLNLVPSDLSRLLFDDIPFLEVAQAEHDRFAELLRREGVEVLYLERLVAEALEAVPGARQEFTSQFLAECGVHDRYALAAIRELLDGIASPYDLVLKTMAGISKRELELPLEGRGGALWGRPGAGATTLASLVGEAAEPDTELIVDPMPNLYFTRDPFCVVGPGVCLNRMYQRTRRRETIYGRFLFACHPAYRQVPLWYDRDLTYHVEGGDVLVLGERAVAVGLSQRTEAAAIDTLAARLIWDEACPVEEVWAFRIPESRAFMHLDTVLTQIDVDKFTVHPGVLGTLQVFRISRGAHEGELAVEEVDVSLARVLARILGLDGVRLIRCGGGDPIAAAREQWNDGSNTLAIAPGRICVYQRNTATNEALARAGLELVVLPSSELSRGRGGPRCMSMPFVRDRL
ncbi:arginine deiminase [uncultured Parolsenella sp.]|uniref:arginine deiminase n=1 Tax=uncultured Parolsenella sp. TaxID=2083008 RepID=UPI0025E3B1D9|nr:arginine deiminase [uncultured Parolsenella sp.]